MGQRKFKHATEPSPAKWYWTWHPEASMSGPFDSREAALADLKEEDDALERYKESIEGEEDPPSFDAWIETMEVLFRMRRPPLSTDIFTADYVLYNLESLNEEAIWDESPPDWPTDKPAGRELEMMLADALYHWMCKHGLWGEFRALEEVSGSPEQ